MTCVKEQQSKVTTVRLCLFISQILYVQTDYFSVYNTQLTNVWVTQVVSKLPFSMGLFCMLIFGLVALYGWFQYYALNRASKALLLTENFLFPLSFFFIFRELKDNGLDIKTVLLGILPLIVVCISTLVHIIFVQAYYEQEQYNQFMSSDIIFRVFQVLRIVALAIISIFLNDNVLVYIILVFTIVYNLYKWNKVVYYFPQTQWCSSISLIWAWISLLKFILRIKGFHFFSLNLGIIVLGYFYFFPNSKILSYLELKIQKVLNQFRQNGNKQYQVFICVYYASTMIQKMNCPLSELWSSKFKFMIENHILDRNQKTKSKASKHSYFQNLTRNDEYIPNSQYSLFQTINPGEKSMKVLENFISKRSFLFNSNQSPIQSLMFFIYFLMQIQYPKYIQIYQMYYTLQNLHSGRVKQIFIRKNLNILYNLLNGKKYSIKYQGTYIEQIIKYDEFNSLLMEYSINQRKFISLLLENLINVQQYKQYLQIKMDLKEKMQKQLHLLQFTYPNDPSLKAKNYIYDRFIENNQLTSKQLLMYRIVKQEIRTKKTMDFSQQAIRQGKVVFLCDFFGVKGLITYYNANFKEKFVLDRELTLKVHDLVPQFWRNSHDDKIGALEKLENYYEHDRLKVYYACIPNTYKYVEVTSLRVFPYCELNNQIFFAVEMEVNNEKDIKIFAQEEKNSRLTSNRHGTMLQDSNENIFNRTETQIQVFGKKYRIQSVKEELYFQTTNLIQEQESSVNDNVQAIIKLGVNESVKKIQAFEKNRKGVDLFADYKWFFFGGILISALGFLFGGALVIGQSYKEYGTVIRNGVIFEIISKKTVIETFNFEDVLITISQSFSFDQKGLMRQIFIQDAQMIVTSFQDYQRFIQSTILYKQLRTPITKIYELNQFGYDQKTNLIPYLQNYGVFLRAANQYLLRNQISYWVMEHTRKIIKQIQSIQLSEQFILNVVIRQVNKNVIKVIQKYQLIFWDTFIVMIVCFSTSVFIYWKSTQVISKVLTKPLFLSDTEMIYFKQNYKELIKQEEEKEYSNKTGTQKQIALENKSVLVTLQIQSANFQVSKQNKKIIGSFYNVIPFFFVFFLFFAGVEYICFKSFRINKQEVQTRLQGFAEYSTLNSKLFVMFGHLLNIVNQENRPLDQKMALVDEVQFELDQIANYKMASTLQKMFFDPTRIYDVLFVNPCLFLQSKICELNDRNLNPFPVQMNFFISTVYKMLAYIKLNPEQSKKSPRMQAYVQSSYISLRSLGEINNGIFLHNIVTVQNRMADQEMQTVIFMIISIIFVLTIIMQVWKVVLESKKYGTEVVHILPSRALCQSKTLEYEVNCIVYRNNFARHGDTF